LNKLANYIYFTRGKPPQGLFIDFVEDRKEAFQRVFEAVNIEPSVSVPQSASLDRFAVIKPKTHISDNVLVAQRAYPAKRLDGKRRQRPGKLLHHQLPSGGVQCHRPRCQNHRSRSGTKCLRGIQQLSPRPAGLPADHRKESVIMPHTIIDIKKPLSIPAGTLVWGLIMDETDLETTAFR
jgi:hypothetical protein